NMADKIELTKAFIEQELPAAPPSYVSVYLMTLATGGTAAEVARKLNTTETEVLFAWGYWKGKGYLQEAEEKQEKQQPVLISSERPDYSPAELLQVGKHPDVMRLFQSAQKTLGKMLNHSDMSLLFSFHDWLGMPVGVIELLLSYCAANGHTGMRYIEKVALGWAEEGITTEEQAVEYIEMRKTGFRTIMKAFGQSRLPVDKEEEYMKKWLQDYKLPLEVVKMACERTVMQTSKVSFAYADRILENWRNAGVKTAADVEAQDKAFAAKKAQNTPAEKPAVRNESKPRQNRFINYTQSEWDFAELERLEREQREKW
ncbi:MAG: DnaD domain protein, partial [Anaerotignum sp.]|nr:DnaD domain protein [Anaerotignum sp.]